MMIGQYSYCCCVLLLSSARAWADYHKTGYILHLPSRLLQTRSRGHFTGWETEAQREASCPCLLAETRRGIQFSGHPSPPRHPQHTHARAGSRRGHMTIFT